MRKSSRLRALTVKYRALWSAIAWTWLAAVVVLSLGPSVTGPGALPTDKLYHALAYFGLQWLFGSLHRGTARHVALAAAFIALGIGLELLQGMTAHRLADPWDAGANAAGVLVGLLVLRRFGSP